MWIFLALLLVLIWWGGSHGWFASISNTLVNNTYNNNAGGDTNTDTDGNDGVTPPTSDPLNYFCADSDGKDNFAVAGNCQANGSGMGLGVPDYCVGNTAFDYYCDTDKTCKTTSRTCQCYGGSCLSCDQIHPTIASNCDLGLCATGSCTFVPATSVQPAKCECG